MRPYFSASYIAWMFRREFTLGLRMRKPSVSRTKSEHVPPLMHRKPEILACVWMSMSCGWGYTRSHLPNFVLLVYIFFRSVLHNLQDTFTSPIHWSPGAGQPCACPVYFGDGQVDRTRRFGLGISASPS